MVNEAPETASTSSARHRLARRGAFGSSRSAGLAVGPWVAVAVVALSLTSFGLLPLLGPGEVAPTTQNRVAAMSSARPAATFPTPIRHVIVISFENRDLGQVMRQSAPFEHYLAAKFALSGQSYSVRHDSEPYYIAETSGIDPDLFSVGRYHVTNIGDLANAAGESWISYFQGMPGPCYGNYAWTSGYEVTHDPFVQYSDIWSNYPYCSSHVRPFNAAQWNSSVASGTIPNYVFIGPSIFNDQHSGTLGQGSAWLASVVNPVLNSSVFSSTAVIVSYDEGLATDNSGFNASFAGNVYTAIASPYARHGYNSSHPYQSYSILTTTEWLLGLGRTGQNDSWALYPPMRDLFTFPQSMNPPAPYTVSGVVTNASSHLPIGGAHIVAASSTWAYGVDTGPNGHYSLPVTAGVQKIWVTDNGYFGPPPVNLTISGNVANENFALRLVPYRQYTVSGVVTNATSNLPINGAEVLFSGVTVAELKEQTTSLNGTFAQALPNGTYSVSAFAPGYVTVVKPLNVSGAGLASFNFALAPNVTRVANFTLTASAKPDHGYAPLNVHFVANASGGAPPYTYQWHFGDNSTGSNLSKVYHRFNVSGNYTVAIVATDSAGTVRTAYANVTALAPPGTGLAATARVESASCGPNASYTVTFLGNATGGAPPYSYHWAFGDGGTGVGPNPTHTYATRATFTAVLSVTDAARTRANASATATPIACPGGGGGGLGFFGTIVGWIQAHPLITIAAVVVLAVIVAVSLAVRSRRSPTTVIGAPPR
jgi:PKD repeat protein